MTIDLGSYSTKIGKGSETRVFPTTVAVDQRSGEIVEFGESARALKDRAPDHIDVVHPVSRGLITDLDLAARLLQLMWKEMGRTTGLFVRKPRVLASTNLSRLDRNVLNEAMPTSGSGAEFLPKGLACAAAAGRDPNSPQAVCVVDFGAEVTEVSVYAQRRVIRSQRASVGSNDLTKAIRRGASNQEGADLSWGQAEKLKENYFDLNGPSEATSSTKVTARDRVTGLPVELDIAHTSLVEWVTPLLEKQKSVLRAGLSDLPPRTASDIYQEGLVLTGGGSLQRGIEEFVHRAVGVKSEVTESAIEAATKGAVKL